MNLNKILTFRAIDTTAMGLRIDAENMYMPSVYSSKVLASKKTNIPVRMMDETQRKRYKKMYPLY